MYQVEISTSKNKPKNTMLQKNADESSFLQILNPDSTPTRKKTFSIATEDNLSRLDRQVADVKRKQKNGALSGSLNKRLAKNYSLLNSSPSPAKVGNFIAKPKILISALLNPERNKKNNIITSNDSLKNTSISASSSIIPTQELSVEDTQIIDSSSSNKKYPSITKGPERIDSASSSNSISTPSAIGNHTSVDISDLRHSSNSNSSNFNLKNNLNMTITTPRYTVQPHNPHLLSSSPVKKITITKPKKQVAFSSDIESSNLSSSPIKGYNNLQEPKSILKFNNMNDSTTGILSIDEILKLDLSDSKSWQEGVVLQIPYRYENLNKVIDECCKGLGNPKFTKNYEVYATLNHLIKSNNEKKEDLIGFFSDQNINNIINSVEIDMKNLVEDLKNGSNAFQLRLASQGLKLITQLRYIKPLPRLSLIYDLSCTILKSENISKSMVSAIIQFVKTVDEDYYEKVENITICLIQMKYFASSSVNIERLNAIKRFILLQPALLNKCNYQILSHVLYSILNTDVNGYSKILVAAISILTCMARNSESKIAMGKLLTEEIESSFTSSPQNSNANIQPWMSLGQITCETINYMIHIQLYAYAAKVWTYLLYMTCYNKSKFMITKWKLFSYFESSFVNLLTKPLGFVYAIESWKVIIYNFQIAYIKDKSDTELRDYVDSLLLPFKNTNVESINEKISSWTYHQGFVILYCRLFYALRLHMDDTVNGSHQAILLEGMLKPLKNLREWDSTYSYIVKMIFTSDRFIYTETAESCFWLSEFEKWKGRILPISKTMFKNEKIFNVVINMSKETSNISLDLVSNFIGICVFEPLASLKLKCPFREYMKFAELVGDLLFEIFQKYTSKIDDADKLFKLIENTDDDFIFSADQNLTYLMTRLLNCLNDTKKVETVNHFISLCCGKFDKTKLFISCLVSNIYDNEQLILDDDKNGNQFPYFLHYIVDVIEFKHENEFELTELEQEKIINNLEQMMITLNISNFKDKFKLFIDFLQESNLLETLNDHFKFESLNILLKINNEYAANLLPFYKCVPESFFEYSLLMFNKDNDTLENGYKLANFILKFEKVEEIPQSWILLIGSKLVFLLHSELKFSDSLVKQLRKIELRLPLKTVYKVKKTAIKRNCPDFPFLKTSIKETQEEIKDFKDSSEIQKVVSTEPISNDNISCIESSTFKIEKSEVTNSSTIEPFSNDENDNDNNNINMNRGVCNNMDITTTNNVTDDMTNNENDQTTPIPVNNLKSFIIDSIQIDDIDDQKITIRVPSSPTKPNLDDNNNTSRSSSKRTRSQSHIDESEILDEWSAKRRKELRLIRKQERKERKERRRRSRSKSTEVEGESKDEIEYDNQQGMLKGANITNDALASGEETEEDSQLNINDTLEIKGTDMDQFRMLLKKINEESIKVDRDEKEELETDLVLLLMKLKKK